MSTYDKKNVNITGFQGVPPSRLGFVCKPDMPPHINILFRARPPLEYVPLPPKSNKKPYEGIFGSTKNIIDLFEKNVNEKRIQEDSKRLTKLKNLIKNSEVLNEENKEKLKECKYLILRYLSKRYSYFYFFLILN